MPGARCNHRLDVRWRVYYCGKESLDAMTIIGGQTGNLLYYKSMRDGFNCIWCCTMFASQSCISYAGVNWQQMFSVYRKLAVLLEKRERLLRDLEKRLVDINTWEILYIIQYKVTYNVTEIPITIIIFAFPVWSQNQHIWWIMPRAHCHCHRQYKCYIQSFHTHMQEIWRGEYLHNHTIC